MLSLETIIRYRRIVKPENFTGEKTIPDSVIRELIELAGWAPTHGYTEPGYFVVFAGENVRKFCRDHAEMYRLNTPPDRFTAAAYEKLDRMGNTTSHIITLCMKRGDIPKIPEQEELISAACGAQNILLVAAARGIAVYWGTGGMTYHPAMRDYLGLSPEDRVLGFLYLGFAEGSFAKGRRLKPQEEKIKWV